MGACPLFASTYGKKVEGAEPERTFDLPAARQGAFHQVKFLWVKFRALRLSCSKLKTENNYMELFSKPGWFLEKLPKKRSNRTKARFFI
jgi:hypothetical protein